VGKIGEYGVSVQSKSVLVNMKEELMDQYVY
jgi:hypothetical protein